MKPLLKKFCKYMTWLIAFGVACVIGVVLFVCYCNYAVRSCGKYCYSDIEKLPVCETALVPGAARVNPWGEPNEYFRGRIEATAKLYHAGKIKHILLSGDNSRKDYDEPTDMKNALIERGVPAKNLLQIHTKARPARQIDTIVLPIHFTCGCSKYKIQLGRFPSHLLKHNG